MHHVPLYCLPPHVTGRGLAAESWNVCIACRSRNELLADVGTGLVVETGNACNTWHFTSYFVMLWALGCHWRHERRAVRATPVPWSEEKEKKRRGERWGLGDICESVSSEPAFEAADAPRVITDYDPLIFHVQGVVLLMAQRFEGLLERVRTKPGGQICHSRPKSPNEVRNVV